MTFETILGSAQPEAPAAAAAAPGAEGSKAPAAAPAQGSKPAEAAASQAAPAEGSKPGDPEKPNEKPQGAPEKYTDFSVPEGIVLDKAMTDEFVSVAKKLNLSQEAAQELVSFQAKHTQSQGEALLASHKELVDGWATTTKQELGANYAKEIGFAGKAIERFGSSELRQFLAETGVGNHKLLVSFFSRVGKAVSEDGFVEGNKGGNGGEKTAAEVMYGNSKK